MKIGIITHYLHFGYGGVLQNFALQRVLKSLGHDPITLKVALVRKKNIYEIIHDELSRIFHRYLGHDIGITKEQDKYISKNVEPFIQKYIKTTDFCGSKRDFRKAAEQEQCKVLIVGSDQIWRASYAYVKECFLDFAIEMNIKRIAYAASIAVDDWEYTPKQTKYIKPMAKKFDAISVREASGISLCRTYLDVDAELVLDPTLLLEKEDYIQIVRQADENLSDGDLFSYVLDKSDDKEAIIEGICTKTNLKRFECMPKYKTQYAEVKKYPEECVYPPITKWLRSFMDAKLVITDSFHGTVFSIIFNKPFYVLINVTRGSARFTSLLKLFGLEDRIISSIEDVKVENNINWEFVNKKKKEWQKKSINFLRLVLDDTNFK